MGGRALIQRHFPKTQITAFFWCAVIHVREQNRLFDLYGDVSRHTHPSPLGFVKANGAPTFIMRGIFQEIPHGV
jgi:hypothetical protein